MSQPARKPSAVAVVGIHGRFPKASDLDQFWFNLTHGVDPIDVVPADRWNWAALERNAEAEGERAPSNRGGFTPHVDRFDHGFFGIMPREAQAMDPQQRLFLQAAWSALEDAGYAPSSLAGRKVGVFAGVGNADYPVLMRRDGVPTDAYRGTGIALTAVANRVSFLLDVCGPSQTIDTACSSSLVAIHRAVQAIEGGDCEMAIAGGVNLLLGPELFVAFSKAGMLSPSGRCRSFDAEADGYVRGEGVGAVVLLPLKAAETNGDYVYGIIRGTAENHGGRAHSFTAPNVHAQAAVVGDAWRKAGLPVSRAAVIETHGTGTPLGDPIEINALKKCLSESDADRRGQADILLGALKSHIGHLEAAAGVAGVIKTLLTLQHRLVPANLHFRSLNPHIKTEGTPLEVAAGSVAIDGDGAPLVAGVSSFGFGGVNAHLVIEEAAVRSPDRGDDDRPYLVLLSARNEASLRGRAEQLRRLLGRRQAGMASAEEPLYGEFVRALGLSAPFDATTMRELSLAALGVSLPQFSAALEVMGQRIGRKVTPADLRDHVTLGECADRLAQLGASCATKPLHADADPQGEREVSMPAVSLPPSALDGISLASVAMTMMHGRDAMDERLAIIATSLTDLQQALSSFLAGEGKEQVWWRGNTRGRKGALAPPPAPADWPTVDDLASWAAYWVEAKAAAPRWEILYPGRPRPGKVPLPSYPFRLDRVWYVAPAVAPAALTSGRAPIPASQAAVGQTRISAPARAADDWARCWGEGRAVPPSSMVALGVLAEQAAIRSGGAVSLARIGFARPTSLTGEDPVVRAQQPSRGRPIVVQCLGGGDGPIVLAQAELAPRMQVRPVVVPDGGERRRLDGDGFYGLLARWGLSVAAPYRFVTAAEAGHQAIVLNGRPQVMGVQGNTFWTALLASLLAAAEALDLGGGAPLAPCAVGALTFDIALMRGIERIDIRATQSGGHGRILDIDAVAGAGKTALSIRGMAFRPAPRAGSVPAAARREAS